MAKKTIAMNWLRMEQRLRDSLEAYVDNKIPTTLTEYEKDIALLEAQAKIKEISDIIGEETGRGYIIE